ncbi:MAG TPA: ATP-binding protein [Gemmatimonadaceae bacterium]|nr:ATP-binding protein [Gemmatimonadaceae bacterium]
MRLTQRVLAGSLLVVAVFTALMVILADRRLQRRLQRDAVDTLVREAHVVASQWRARGVNADSLADALGAELERRVTLIDSAGHVVGDSQFSSDALAHLENHSTRPEIVAARQSGTGWGLRPSTSAGDEELYVAVRAPAGFARVSMSTRTLDAIVDGAQRDVLTAALIALLLAFVLTFLFARRVSRPIIELRDVARRLASGDLSQRPQLAAAGEVGDLADALSRMAEQLEARLGALEAEDALTTGLFESLSEGVLAVDRGGRVVRANESARVLLGARDPVPFPATQLPRDRALRDAIAAAQAGTVTEPAESMIDGRTLAVTARPLRGGGAVLALFDLTPFRKLEAVRRDFVANVSHELKTPLTVIGGYAETLADDDSLRTHARHFARTIRNNAQRMQRLVEDLLDLSRIESGGWRPAPELLDVAAAAREAVAPLRAAAEQKGVTLTVRANDAPLVHADPTALRQVISNLVSNAVRHTTRGGITVFSRPDRDGVVIGVCDTGIGIPPEHLPRIFERFYRVDPGRSRAEGGTGLGLSIVRHLVEAHGGRVWAESTVGTGTTIQAVFPNGPAALRDAMPRG